MMAMKTASSHAAQIEERLLMRNEILERFFAREAPRLAKPAARCRSASCAEGDCWPLAAVPYATDAQHVSVEFVHPVIVGKRALPALDLSMSFQSVAQRHSAS
jgi:D-sedoheptulose 7-phosphate isomerase